MTKPMRYKLLNKPETDRVVIDIIERLLDTSVPNTSSAKERFEKGWNENVKAGDIIPRYFGKYRVNRLNGKFVIGFEKNYEVKMLHSIVKELTWKYMNDVKDIYEFGCGTGHNLVEVKKICKNATLHGFDWTASSNKLVQKLGFDAKLFDFFEPDYSIGLKTDSVVYTVAALEQTHTRFERFIGYLLRNKPKLVINIEPIPELLDPNNLLDYLSIKYMQKRKYLTGYLDTLRGLEKQGKLQILEERRSGIGSMFIDGYSVVVWKPL